MKRRSALQTRTTGILPVTRARPGWPWHAATNHAVGMNSMVSAPQLESRNGQRQRAHGGNARGARGKVAAVRERMRGLCLLRSASQESAGRGTPSPVFEPKPRRGARSQPTTTGGVESSDIQKRAFVAIRGDRRVDAHPLGCHPEPAVQGEGPFSLCVGNAVRERPAPARRVPAANLGKTKYGGPSS